VKVAVVHYHLDRGGVAQVIADQLVGLDRLARPDSASGQGIEVPERVVVCYGGSRSAWPLDTGRSLRDLDVRYRVVEELDYECVAESDRLARRLQAVFEAEGCDVADTVVHVHNHSLGKNPALTGAVRILAEAGYRLLLHIHDFPEDQRPANYRCLASALARPAGLSVPDVLYPQASHVHYAALNGRDRALLATAGVPTDRLHLLPNAVPQRHARADRQELRDTLAARCGIPAQSQLLLYPARAIRRKNVGEALLWASALDRPVHVGITLAPLNERERPGYERWRTVAGALQAPISFEVGTTSGLSLEEHFLAADRVLTTSLVEGFGLALLESYAAGRALVGRDLPEITGDFAERGVRLSGVRDRVDIPADWIGASELTETLHRAYNATLRCYGRPHMTIEEIEVAMEAKVESGFVDFGDLDVALQERVLGMMRDDPKRRSKFRDRNGWMADALEEADECTIASNAYAIRHAYSHEQAAARLAGTYASVLSSDVDSAVTPADHGDEILNAFLRFDRFRAVLA
jgi:glycosyltransferase involved in cell wall biosynthesis